MWLWIRSGLSSNWGECRRTGSPRLLRSATPVAPVPYRAPCCGPSDPIPSMASRKDPGRTRSIHPSPIPARSSAPCGLLERLERSVFHSVVEVLLQWRFDPLVDRRIRVPQKKPAIPVRPARRCPVLTKVKDQESREEYILRLKVWLSCRLRWERGWRKLTTARRAAPGGWS